MLSRHSTVHHQPLIHRILLLFHSYGKYCQWCMLSQHSMVHHQLLIHRILLLFHSYGKSEMVW